MNVPSIARRLCLVLAVCGSYSAASRGEVSAEIRSPLEEASAIQRQFRAVVDQASPSVFAVTAFTRAPQESPLWMGTVDGETFRLIADRYERSCGSAFAIDADGRLLTSEHVISNADSVWITDDTGHTFPALVVGTDPRSDLAVLQIPTKTTPLTFASDAPHRGDLAMTLGNPDGISTDGSLSAAIGNVSVADRSLPLLSERERRNYAHMIQVTTPIGVGSSGGPLLDLEGHATGVVCAVANVDARAPIGFAVNLASPTMREHVAHLAKGDEITYGYLGVMVSPETPAGARVDRVDLDTPAHGVLKEGDIVLTFDGSPVRSDKSFIELAGTSPVDRDVPLTVRRGEEQLDLTIRPRRRALPADPVSMKSQQLIWAGVTFVNLPEGGVVVEATEAGASLTEGTVIQKVNGDAIANLGDLLTALHKHAGKTLDLDEAK